jgi:hypothetical protein
MTSLYLFSEFFLGRQPRQDVKLSRRFRDWLRPHLQGVAGSLVEPKLRTRCPHRVGVSSCNAWQSSHFDAAVCPGKFHWVLSPPKLHGILFTVAPSILILSSFCFIQRMHNQIFKKNVKIDIKSAPTCFRFYTHRQGAWHLCFAKVIIIRIVSWNTSLGCLNRNM